MRRRFFAAALSFVVASNLAAARAGAPEWMAPTTSLIATTPVSTDAQIAPSATSSEATLLSQEAPATQPAPAEATVADGIVLDEAVMQASNTFQAAGGAAVKKPAYPLIVNSGFAQVDGIWFAQDAANQAVVGDAQDVGEFRRARLGAKGNLTDNVSCKMEYDFAFPRRPNFTDVWVNTSALPVLGNVKVGQWKQPFSMEPATSIREVMFMERSLWRRSGKSASAPSTPHSTRRPRGPCPATATRPISSAARQAMGATERRRAKRWSSGATTTAMSFISAAITPTTTRRPIRFACARRPRWASRKATLTTRPSSPFRFSWIRSRCPRTITR